MFDVHTKSGTSPEQVVRLRHEAEVLAAARHPGVVELLDDRTTDALSPALVTAWAGPASLAETAAPTVEEAAGIVAALADTVAALHDIGIVHGRIEPSHVVLADSGLPVLCGFAEGGYAATIAADGTLLAEAGDVHDLGVLLRSLVIEQGNAEPIPERPWWLGGRHRWTGYTQRGLLTIADRATDDDPDRRPSAAELAELIRDAVPDAHLPVAADRDRDPFARLRRVDDDAAPGRARGRQVTLLIGGIGLALLLVGASSLRGTSGAARTTTRPMTTAASSPATTLATLPSASPTTTGPPPTVAIAGATYYSIGQPGDVVVVGDWDCDGQPTPTLLRPTVGEVFRFAALATADADVTVGPAATVPGAVGLRADAAAGGCQVLVALFADGSTVEVPT